MVNLLDIKTFHKHDQNFLSFNVSFVIVELGLISLKICMSITFWVLKFYATVNLVVLTIIKFNMIRKAMQILTICASGLFRSLIISDACGHMRGGGGGGC